MQKPNTKRLATISMLAAISVILVTLIHFPIFPAVSFLAYDGEFRPALKTLPVTAAR